MDEIWKWVAGYEGFYEVSNIGRVRSTGASRTDYVAKPKVLKPGATTKGYPLVVLYREKRPSTKLVHILVATAFVPNPAGLPEVNHVDTLKSNNAATNLEWTTRLGNVEHARIAGLIPKGETHGGCKVAESAIREIRQQKDVAGVVMAARFNLSTAQVSRIRNGLNWAHVAA